MRMFQPHHTCKYNVLKKFNMQKANGSNVQITPVQGEAK